jgi:HK97 family phage portal protein
MRLFGLDITRAKAAQTLSPPHDRAEWWHIISEPHIGAWQQDIKISHDTVQTFHAVFACQTLIASDISKLRIKLVALDQNGIWTETSNPAYSPVLRKPNPMQNRMQFIESWVLSKLQRGNTYALKRRDGSRKVRALYVLDPQLVQPLVAPSGDVFYRLQTDHLAELPETVTVPASEIIHDRFNCFFHPLVGLSPIFASGLAATQGLSIQKNSTRFFENGSKPGGILAAPGEISDETAKRLKEHWETNYSGSNAGKVAVLGDGLKYESMTVDAVDSQMIEQLKYTGEVVCSTYHVPPYKVGIGQQPTYNNVQALNTEYYSQCLQVLFEAIELCLDEGLGTGEKLGTEFDIDNLLRMDTLTQMDTLDKGKNVFTPNEARKRVNMPPVTGGDSVYRQQQDYSLEALAKRDAKDDPFAKTAPPKSSEPGEDDDAANDNEMELQAAKALLAVTKGFACV